ncbi:MAG: ankyrin repeat domain-containing protein [Armatimonadota bacterium]|nr:ankyrin repeat domain-containing protein [Armatimonadota bacterium]
MKPLKVALCCIIVLHTLGCAYRAEMEFIDACRDGNISKIKRMAARNPTLVNTVYTDPPFPDKLSVLHIAIADEHKDVARFLILHGADTNVRNTTGDTPLHYAASWGNEEIVRLILKKGGDPTIKDDHGEMPEDWALQEKHYKIVKILAAK